MRLIDADELKAMLPSNCDLFMQVIGVIHLIDEVKEIELDSFVKRGKWIEDGQTTRIEEYFCSLCYWPEISSKGHEKYRYCPNCGAKMDLEV